MIQFGLIGASQIAQFGVIPAIRAQADAGVLSVFSSHLERGKAYAETCQIPKVFNSLDELLADPEIQAVYISTTNELHHEQTLKAARAGKHILCEKPLAMSLEQGREMVQVCQEAGVVLATNHHLRNAGTLRKIRELIQTGAVGKPIAARVFHAVYLREDLQSWRINKPQAGGGVVLDIVVHDVDLLRFLLNAEPIEVTSFSQHFGMGENVEDGSMAVFRFDNGLLAQVHTAFTVRYAGNGIEIHGTEGSIIAKGALHQSSTGEVLLRNAQGEQVIETESADLHGGAVRRFLDAIQGKGTPAATGEDGLRSMAAALACLESARTGCKQAIVI